ADAGLFDLLDLRGDKTDFARPDLGQVGALGRETADPVDQMLRAALHEPHFQALLDPAVDDADQDDDAEIGIVPAIDEHGLQWRGAVAPGRRNALDHGLKHILDPDAGFGGG